MIQTEQFHIIVEWVELFWTVLPNEILNFVNIINKDRNLPEIFVVHWQFGGLKNYSIVYCMTLNHGHPLTMLFELT